MLAAGALVRSVLAAGAVGLARHTRAVLGICVGKNVQRARVTILKREKER